ncbi:hypothetical protein LTR95_002821 [Oleoguttula sp. CCFEE 5521]
MEKLILRGVMYGADKIPDQWFDKVPGGFYKQKEEARRERERSRRRDGHGRSGGGERDHRREEPRRRRYSDEYEDRSRKYNTNDDGYGMRRSATNGQAPKRYSRGANSVDGADDEGDPYFDGDRPKYMGRQHVGRQERYDPRDDDRYGYEDGYGARGRREEEGRYEPPPLGSDSGRGKEYVAAATAAGAAAAAHGQRERSDPPATGGAGQYVPYAHLYGEDATRGSVTGSVQPNSMNQVGAAFSPPASTAGAGTARFAEDQSGYDDSRRRSYSPSEYDTGYIPPARVARHRSPSYDRYDSRPRRTRSERRRPSDHPSSRTKSRGKSLSRMKENFDTSQKGLGYGGVGALAGAAIGKDMGKGPLPAAIGAVLGGVGANAFGARERFVNDRFVSSDRRDAKAMKQEKVGRKDPHRRSDSRDRARRDSRDYSHRDRPSAARTVETGPTE